MQARSGLQECVVVLHVSVGCFHAGQAAGMYQHFACPEHLRREDCQSGLIKGMKLLLMDSLGLYTNCHPVTRSSV